MTTRTGAPERAEHAAQSLDQAVREAPAVDLSWIAQPLVVDGWAAAPDLLQLLFALVRVARPRHVVEFGSGVSTLVLARAAARCGDCVVTSLDHDPKFAHATTELLASGADAHLVTVQCAPLVARVRAGELMPAYDVDNECLASPRPADVIFIDGPPAALGGRRGMIYQALEYAQSGSIILLDDAAREGEEAALAEWEHLLGDAIQAHRLEGFARGLVGVILVAPTTARIRMTPKPK
jgi:predicted O-methyltransferase YrrM